MIQRCNALDNVGGCCKTVGHKPCTCKEQIKMPKRNSDEEIARLLKIAQIDFKQKNYEKLSLLLHSITERIDVKLKGKS